MLLKKESILIKVLISLNYPCVYTHVDYHDIMNKLMIPQMIRGARNLNKVVRYSFCTPQLSPEALRYDNLAKEKLYEDKFFSRVMVKSGRYKLEYFHTFGSNDKVAEKSGHLSTTRSPSSVVLVQTHEHVGVSLYETLQDVQSGKWIKFTTTGN